MTKFFLNKIFLIMLFLLLLNGCNKFNLRGLAASFGYNSDECETRDRTHHSKPYANGMSPSMTCVHYRRFICRIERVCVGKTEIENETCRQDARNYWRMDERKPKICDNAPE